MSFWSQRKQLGGDLTDYMKLLFGESGQFTSNRLRIARLLICIPLLLTTEMSFATTGWQYSWLPGCFQTRSQALDNANQWNNPDTIDNPPYVSIRDYYVDNGIGNSITWYAHYEGCAPGQPPCTGEFSYQEPDLNVCGRVEDAPKSAGKPANCNCEGDPINAADGNLFESELDYIGTGAFPLHAERFYNSMPGNLSGWGNGWRGYYDRSIVVLSHGTYASAKRMDGKVYRFYLNNNVWTADSDITDHLVQTQTGWTYTNANNETETYDTSGKLIFITSQTGQTQNLTYSCGPTVSATCPVPTPTAIAPYPNLLITVSDQFGRQLHFTYDAYQRVASMTDPSGGKYMYAYSGTAYSDNLVSVTYPDSKVRTYLYGESAYTSGASLPHNLTGILDESNQRYSTWNYDSTGRAVSSEHAVGVEKTILDFSSGIGTVVSDPSGSTRTHQFQTILGVIKSSGVTRQPDGASTLITYDANGNVASRTDFNGNVTTYQYDLTRNLETQRIEASGTPQARTISTQWHPTYRLPIAIAEPLRLTTFNYDTNGNLLDKTIQATTDANGSQGFNAQTSGAPRTWSYTYNQYGQVLTAKGPRTDINDTTTYTYDNSTGNLLTVTNAAGQVTTLSNYDANGRVGTITDPNGIVTNLAYYPRGWLQSKSVRSADGSATQITTYNYDGVGQLKNVTLPDNSTINYTYDDAHRLTDIADSLGNTIHYVLDAMGNRTDEQVKDTNGTLTRHISRLYDALNRLQQVTGGVQ
jgi:YD repeat-containing protein